MAVDARITNSEGAGVSTHRGVRAYGNSLGFLAAYPHSHCREINFLRLCLPFCSL
jgi:predicted Zn-dependent protease